MGVSLVPTTSGGVDRCRAPDDKILVVQPVGVPRSRSGAAL